MGKIRIKHVGFGGIEQEEKKKAQKRRQTKKEKKKTVRAPGLKGGERVVAVGPTPEELEKELKKEVEPQRGTFETPKTPKLPKLRSSRYQKLAKLVSHNKLYSPTEALKLLKKMANANFTGTVEAHINLKRVLSDKIRVQFRSEKEHAAPATKGIEDLRPPKLTKSSKGTRKSSRSEASSKSTRSVELRPSDPLGHGAAGSNKNLNVHFEKKFPLAHAVLGKVDEPIATLEKNLETLIKKVGGLANMKKLTFSTTMSPSLKIAFSPN